MKNLINFVHLIDVKSFTAFLQLSELKYAISQLNKHR